LHMKKDSNQETGSGKLCQREFTGVSNGSEEAIEGFKEFQKNTFYSALLLPFWPFEYKAKNKMERVVQKVLFDSLKKSNEVMKFVIGVLPHIPKAVEFAHRISQI